MSDVVFLPGIIAPAGVRYGPLLGHLSGVHATLKDLEVYASDQPPPGYSVQVEVDGIEATANSLGLDRFHLYGHSAGAAFALAYVAAHPDRVLSLALDEPASDFTDADQADPHFDEVDAALALPPKESVPAFFRLLVAPGVDLPPAPTGDQPPWMATRPAGVAALASVLRRHHVSVSSYQAFNRPVLFTFGSRTHPRMRTMRDRLLGLFPDFTSEEFEGLHHLNTSHQAEPERVAATLKQLWDRAESASF